MNSKWKYHEIYQVMWDRRGMSEEQVNKYNYISLLNWLSFYYEKNKVEANKLTLNNILDAFKAYVNTSGSMLVGFGYGPTSEFGRSTQMEFPCLWITHTQASGVDISGDGKAMIPILRISILILDQVTDSKNVKVINGEDSNNGQEIVSDCFQVAQDLIAWVNGSANLRQLGVSLYKSENPTIDPVFDDTTDRLNGVMLGLSLRLNYNNCVVSASTYCLPGVFENSDATFTQFVNSGSTFISEDITVTLADGPHVFPSNVDINLPQYAIVSNPSPGTYVPGTFQLPWNSNSANVSIAVDGEAVKNDNDGSWNDGADFIIEKTGNFTLNFKMTNTINNIGAACGIDFFKGGDTDYNYTGIDMSFFRDGTTLYIYEDSGFPYIHPDPVDDTTQYTIQRQSNFVFYKVDGVTKLKVVMDKYGQDVVKELAAQLLRAGKRASGKLINSLNYDLREIADEIQLRILAEDYLTFVDEGRKAGKWPNISAIEKWVRIKGIPQTAVFPIAKSIYRFGIRPTN
ncbi:hypothetical protein DAPPUDRAFT_271961, partial [Daphnia pulex]